jgi:ribosomal-protein-alanine N-acetyltransferase
MTGVAFETERLIARTWSLDDAEAAFEMYGDPDVVRFIGGHLQESVATTRELLDAIRARATILPAGMGSFPLVRRDTGELVGTALIKPLPGGDEQPTDDIEIGWHLARRHWGNGYATEAGRALLRRAFDDLELRRIHAVVEPANDASHAVARRLGMSDLGTTDAYYGRTLRHYALDRDPSPGPGAAPGSSRPSS